MTYLTACRKQSERKEPRSHHSLWGHVPDDLIFHGLGPISQKWDRLVTCGSSEKIPDPNIILLVNFSKHLQENQHLFDVKENGIFPSSLWDLYCCNTTPEKETKGKENCNPIILMNAVIFLKEYQNLTADISWPSRFIYPLSMQRWFNISRYSCLCNVYDIY